MYQFIFEIYKRGLKRAGSVVIFQYVNTYGPLSGLPYYSPTPLHSEDTPYPPHGVYYPRKLSPVPNMKASV